MGQKKNWLRRSLGLLLGLLPLWLALASLAQAVNYPREEALWLAGAALAVGVFNFSLAFLRPIWLSTVRGLTEFSHVSGAPGIGSLLVLLACGFGFGGLGTSVLALMAVLLDTGGTPWLVASTWRDSSFWDNYRSTGESAKPLFSGLAGELAPTISLSDLHQAPRILKAEVFASPHDEHYEMALVYCVDHEANYVFSLSRFPYQDEIELRVLDQSITRVRDVEVILDGNVLRADLPPEVARELDGTRQYVVNLKATGVELQNVRDALAKIFEGKKGLLIAS
ncbi:hypothetical protein [Delftia sp. ASV31]|uniref:hypothetical protein n=1 Tax=Delftia sp. ASV31 TaxID=2795113 RepID=UPI0018EAE5D4|nr:hypothetical protein [Delftia sp. ASV31]